MFCYLCSAYMLSPLFLDRVLQFVEAWHRGRKGSEGAGIHLSAVRPGLLSYFYVCVDVMNQFKQYLFSFFPQ